MFCPAIEIPQGFFDNNIKIDYGFDERNVDITVTNLNPKINSYFAENIKGIDYKWTTEDIPDFWKSRISKTNKMKHEIKNINSAKSIYLLLSIFILINEMSAIANGAVEGYNSNAERRKKFRKKGNPNKMNVEEKQLREMYNLKIVDLYDDQNNAIGTKVILNIPV